MDSLSEENANENIKIFSGLLVELEKVRTITKINTFKYTKKRYEQSQKEMHWYKKIQSIKTIINCTYEEKVQVFTNTMYPFREVTNVNKNNVTI